MPSEQQMRQAIQERDSRFDGHFVYAVITTGIYCLPSCAARPARPENLRFFADGDTAKQNGFRACQRCRPDRRATEQNQLIELANYIKTHLDQTITLADLAQRAGLSPSRLRSTFKSAFGITPKAYQDQLRANRFKDELRSGESVTRATYEAGYGSSSGVYERAVRHVGMSPAAYRSGGKDETIYYAFGDTVLGRLLMAATEKGICFAQFGETDEVLLSELQTEFSKAILISSPASESPDLAAWISALNIHLEQNAPRPDLPLDLRGTAFQIKVWRFLMKIPSGDAISYSELANGIGEPKAVRAAASACGKNRIAVLIPCHRVLRSDGSLGGYRWGLERKRALLDAERGQKH